MDNSPTYQLIEQYLDGSLSDSEHADVEYRIKNDQDFSLELEVHKAAEELIIDYELIQLKSKMKVWTKGQGGFSIGGSKVFILTALGLITFSLIYWNALNENQISKEVVSVTEKTIYQNPSTNGVSVDVPPNELKSRVTLKSTSFEEEVKPFKPSVGLDNIQNKTFPFSDAEPDKPTITMDPVITPEIVLRLDSVDSFVVRATGSCKGENLGKISFLISEINQLQIIEYSIDAANTFDKYPDFNFLDNSTYTLAVKDESNGIHFSKERVELTSPANCNQSSTITITPRYGEFWKPDLGSHGFGKIEIFNKNQIVVFSSKIEEGFVWHGRTNQEGDLPMGSYLFVLSFSDSSRQTGYITILK